MVAINPFGLTFLSALVATFALSAFADDGCSSGIEIYIPLKPEDRWSGLIVQDWLGEDDFNNTWADAPTDGEYKRLNYARFFKSEAMKVFVFLNGPEDNPRTSTCSLIWEGQDPPCTSTGNGDNAFKWYIGWGIQYTDTRWEDAHLSCIGSEDLRSDGKEKKE